VAKVIPAVVHISCSGGWQGSGVIVNRQGLVVTAGHVIDTLPAIYTVTLSNGKKYVTDKSCSLRQYDIGFLQLEDVNNFPYVEKTVTLNSLRTGDFLFAIGSQFGKEGFNSVTTGVLSARKRNFGSVIPTWSVLFQTDVGANSGSSGGPVFTTDGYLAGIVVGSATQIYAGIIYCVPFDIVNKYLETAKIALALENIQVSDIPVVDPYYNYKDDNEYYFIPGDK
jgi:S1-C subfamily serine protease